MTIERLIADVPTSLELETAHENGILTYAEYQQKLDKVISAEQDYLESILNVWVNDCVYLVSNDSCDLVCYDEIFDFVVEKGLSYLAKVNGHIAVVRTDDNKVFYIVSADELSDILINQFKNRKDAEQ